MKDFIISTYSFLLQLNVIVSTIAGFVIGRSIGGLFGDPMTAAIVGAIIAFCNAAIVSGAGLALDRIRELLEEQNRWQEQDRRERSQISVMAGNSALSYPTSNPSLSTLTVEEDKDARITCPKCGLSQRANRRICYSCEAKLIKE